MTTTNKVVSNDLLCVFALHYLLKRVFFLSLVLILLASSIIRESFMASHCGATLTQRHKDTLQTPSATPANEASKHRSGDD